ncbi:hypothetical protein BN1708_005222 [Verticillium longisporum]|uniref:Uncharacterized protein n=1 Tax=Verticillium longisporum TaxID=100787 RepID=A0A0G4M8E0_VERLO|nr:hypothetical protein BN1708_005222 [Verticillium longisporum]
MVKTFGTAPPPSDREVQVALVVNPVRGKLVAWFAVIL